jgi:thiosulfate dehydrogenase
MSLTSSFPNTSAKGSRCEAGSRAVVKAFVSGVLSTLVALLVIGYVGITQGVLIPANADAKPPALEAWMARRSLHAALAREAPRTPNPLPLTDANLIAGIKLYGDNCIVCHGAADGRPSTVALGLYQHAPQLAKYGVENDPEGVTYWKLDHGIRLTGMPSYGENLSETQLWQLTLFLKHMDKLPAAPEKAWKNLRNPAALATAEPDAR